MRSCSSQVLAALAELVAELGALLVLGLPADEAGPVGEEGLVDDLDTTDGLVFVLAHLVGGEQAGVDEFAEDLGSRITRG